MNNQFTKSTGIALIIGCLLLTLTMVLHPVGGSIEHLIKITTIIIVSHSIAIACIPFLIFGFWGFTRQFSNNNPLTTFAFVVMSVGLFAVMLAGTVNGLALPFFVNRFKEATPETIETVKIVLRYNGALNHAFDYIFMGATCAAILFWSIAILKTDIFKKWIGYFGILLSAGALILLITGFNLVSLHGFRIFSFGLVSWIIITGFFLYKLKPVNDEK